MSLFDKPEASRSSQWSQMIDSYLGGLSGSYGVDLGEKSTFLTQKAHFEAVIDGELTFFMKNGTHNP